jgi:hypothetical protein
MPLPVVRREEAKPARHVSLVRALSSSRVKEPVMTLTFDLASRLDRCFTGRSSGSHLLKSELSLIQEAIAALRPRRVPQAKTLAATIMQQAREDEMFARDRAWQDDFEETRLVPLIEEFLRSQAPAQPEENCNYCGGTGIDPNALNDPGPCPHCYGGPTPASLDRDAVLEEAARAAERESVPFGPRTDLSRGRNWGREDAAKAIRALKQEKI